MYVCVCVRAYMRVYACMSAPVSACKPARFVCMRACVHTRKTRVYVHVLTPMDASFPATIMLTHPDEHYTSKHTGAGRHNTRVMQPTRLRSAVQ